MEPILKTVAREYSRRYPDLTKICFLFPNKRCGVFLRKYFYEFGVRKKKQPHILTISDLVMKIADKEEATRMDQLFTLYNCYLEIVEPKIREEKKEELGFESFRNWGEIVLNDFNTVDTSMASAEEVFKNVKDYREIASYFLTDEQHEVLQDYFGISEIEEPGTFWKKFYEEGADSEVKQKFLNLWQVMYPLHEKFIEKLGDRGEGSSGSIYRRATEIVEEKGREAVDFLKIVAVGFNALTESERRIFKTLRDEEGTPGYDSFMDFIWDSTGPILKDSNFTSSRFVDYNRRHFPEPDWIRPALDAVEVTEHPYIEIVGSPSNTSQTKVASEILKQYDPEELQQLIEESQVALVLPDETLLWNMIYSIPEVVEDINITMGVSMRHSSIATFMSLFRRLYAGMRETKTGPVFFSKDLKMFFTHPYSYILFDADAVEKLMHYISDYHKVTLTLEEIEASLPGAKKVLDLPSKEEKGEKIFEAVERILTLLETKFIPQKTNEEEEEVPATNEDAAYIHNYRESLNKFRENLLRFGIRVIPLTALSLLDKLVGGEKLGFEGEPLVGLQVMGTLETRSLDFRHVIILSMNEGIMPRKAFSSTFIPESLRKSYGLPPARYAEEIFGYYFYRLISRAEKVTLIYDGRAITGLRSGESRYLQQLREYAPADKLTESVWQYGLQKEESKEVSMKKTPEILEMLEAYSKDYPEGKNISASTLDNYRQCEVKFFIKNVLNINDEGEKGEYMDSISIGNVVHEVMMELYMPKEDQGKLLEKPKTLTASRLKEILEDKKMIPDLVKRKINKHYYSAAEENKLRIDSGVTEILADQIEELVRNIVNYDLSIAPVNVYGCEINRKFKIKLSSGREVNVNFAIDRLDSIIVDGKAQLRIIDYKTGKKKLMAKDMESMFEGGSGSSQIFQLFFYAWLLGKMDVKGWEDVRTEIYSVPDLLKDKSNVPQISKVAAESFRPYIDEFSSRLDTMIESIFSSPEFRDTDDCGYCSFRAICGK